LHSVAAIESWGRVLRIDLRNLVAHDISERDSRVRWTICSGASLCTRGSLLVDVVLVGNGGVFATIVTTRKLAAVTIVDSAGRNAAKASIVVVEVLCGMDLWWSGRRKSAIGILHGGYIIG